MKRIISIVLAVSLMAALFLSAPLTAGATELKTGIGTVDAENGLRLREKASLSSPVICIAADGDQVVIIRKAGNWYLVNYNLNIGYMCADYIDVESEAEVGLGTGTMDPWLTNLRSGTSTKTNIIGRISAGEKVDVLGLSDGWYHVRYGDKNGYIRSDLITLTEKPDSNHGISAKSIAQNSDMVYGRMGQEIATYAQSFVGYPYVYGGSSPSGFDCSGFMQYLFGHFGVKINRTATAQLKDGYSVSYDSMRPGDIIYFGYGHTASHVGMYIGNGNFVHAQSSRTGVVITSLSEKYYANRFLCAHRIVD